MNHKKIILMIIAFTSSVTLAKVERKLFTMEKNYNAENVMIIHTQTDEDCKFITSSKNTERNYIEFYWSMNNGNAKKEVHSMIRSEIKERVKFNGINERKDSFKVKLNDLSELRHDLDNTTIEVISEFSQGKCNVKSILQLGASSNYKKMNLKRTYCEVTTSFVGMPNGCKYIQLDGLDADSGEKISVQFRKK